MLRNRQSHKCIPFDSADSQAESRVPEILSPLLRFNMPKVFPERLYCFKRIPIGNRDAEPTRVSDTFCSEKTAML